MEARRHITKLPGIEPEISVRVKAFPGDLPFISATVVVDEDEFCFLVDSKAVDTFAWTLDELAARFRAAIGEMRKQCA